MILIYVKENKITVSSYGNNGKLIKEISSLINSFHKLRVVFKRSDLSLRLLSISSNSIILIVDNAFEFEIERDGAVVLT